MGALSGDVILEALLRSERVGVAVLDHELRCVRVNDLLATITQQPIEAHLGRTIGEVLGVPLREVDEASAHALSTGEPVRDVLIPGYRLHLRTSYFPLPEREGVVVVAVEDNSEAEGELGARLRFEGTLLHVTAALVGARSDGIGGAIDRALALGGEALGADRAVVFLTDLGAAVAPIAHVWTRPGLPVQHRVGEARPIAGTWMLAELAAGRTVSLARPEDLPPEAEVERHVMDDAGLGALILSPLAAAGQLFGAVAFECDASRRWPHTVVTRVVIFSEIVAAALHRERLEREAAEERAFERIVADVSARFVERPFADLDVTLTQICAALGAIRMHLFELDWLRRRGRLVKEGGAPGLYATDDEVPIEVLAPALAWREPEHSDTVLLERGGLTAASLRVWEESGIHACAVAPLMVEGRSVGCLGFAVADKALLDARFHERIDRLKHIFASAMARTLAERAQARAHAELEALKSRIEGERDYLREEASDARELIFESASMQSMLSHVMAVAPTDAAVLLIGETGVGKEVVARHVHRASARRDGPLIKVNCASVPTELFESEFFGHVRGAFTGAQRDRRGRFELADGGTLFLDEVGEIPLALQAKLLRVLQEGELERVGDDRTLRVDVRVVAATNRDLEREVEEGRFRRDLFYRLGVFPIHIPPLRERGGDVLLLARAMLERQAARLGRRGLVIGADEGRALLGYAWPGNVRELQHVIERAVILSPEPPLRLEQLGAPGRRPPPASSAPPRAPRAILTAEELRALERENLEAALAETGKVAGRGGAAERLGVSPSTMRDRMKALGIRSR